MTEAQKPAPSRLFRWVAAIGLGVPIALIALAASPLGPNFIYVVVGIPALLCLWVVAGRGALKNGTFVPTALHIYDSTHPRRNAGSGSPASTTSPGAHP